ncbi:MAG: Rieske (2Fe-2S) protein [Flavobacteriales bacterium]|nr:Rieske (2Fe-2S) protein [Flavobacteriales bacterium]
MPLDKKLHNLPPFPNGWYVIERSELLPAGKLITKRFAGQDVIVFRTESGKACVMDAYCPHMGAHFGHGGCIVGESVKCPFHGFEFNTSGKCTKTGYGTEPPPKALAKTFPVQEVNGLILLYYHCDNEPPTWQIPEMDMTGWTDFRWVDYELKSHPQETTENSVDIGHFSETHGYRNVKVVKNPIFEENHLTINYGMERDNFMGKSGKPVQIEFIGHVYGLGYSVVEAKTLNFGITTRHFVLPTPIEDGKIILRIASSVKKVRKSSDVHALASVLPKSLLNYILSKVVFKGYKNDVRQDFKIWENKKYIMQTPLAKGDGPIVMYRKWAQQFYSEEIGI